MASQLSIRPLEPADWPAVWQLPEPVFRAGETFPHDPAISEAEARILWVEQSQAVMVALDEAGAVVGSYYLRPNSLALGAHVANAGYVVAESHRRQGIGSRLCQHSLQAARRLGFRPMQFNLDGELEILSLAGTLSPDGAHLHAAVADNAGAVSAAISGRARWCASPPSWWLGCCRSGASAGSWIRPPAGPSCRSSRLQAATTTARAADARQLAGWMGQ